MDAGSSFDLKWLFPNFDNILNLDFIPSNGSELSALFVAFLLLVCFGFTLSYLFYYFKAMSKLRWLKRQLKGVDRSNVLDKRVSLEKAAEDKKMVWGICGWSLMKP